MTSSGIGGGERGSRDRSSDSNDHNSDDENGGGGLSGAEDEDGGHPADQTGQSAGKKKKKVFFEKISPVTLDPVLPRLNILLFTYRRKNWQSTEKENTYSIQSITSM